MSESIRGTNKYIIYCIICVVVMLYCWWCFFATKLCLAVLCVALCPGIGWVVGCGGLLESDSGAGAGVWCDHGQCTVHGVPTTTTSLHCVTPHHNPRYSVPSVAPAQPQLSIFCRSSAPVSRIMIPPDLSPQSFLQLPQSSCKPKFSRGASRDSFNFWDTIYNSSI